MLMHYTSEEDILCSIDSFFEHSSRRKDDADILPHNSYVTSVDIVSENLDFRRHTFSPQNIGYKALAVNISDCMAMGAIPHSFLMALSLPQTIEKVYLESILEGMSTLARRYNISLIGGDIAFEDSLRFAITIFGIPITEPIRRGNASVGDSIFYLPSSLLLSPLGLARVGFETLEEGVHGYPEAKKAQCEPTLVELDSLHILAPFAQSLSLMDSSDGLSSDIPRLLGTHSSSLGAELVISEDLLHHEVLTWCASRRCNPVEFALHGGEEYCLLGTAPPHIMSLLQDALPHIVVLGTVTQGNTISCNGNVVKK